MTNSNLRKQAIGFYVKIPINGKIFHIHGMDELILLTYQYYPKQSCEQIQCNPYQNPMVFFIGIGKTMLKFLWTHKHPH